MSEKFSFSLRDVDLDDDDQGRAFATRVWAQAMTARTVTDDNKSNERENEIAPITLTHRYADAVAYASDLHSDQTRKSKSIPRTFHICWGPHHWSLRLVVTKTWRSLPYYTTARRIRVGNQP